MLLQPGYAECTLYKTSGSSEVVLSMLKLGCSEIVLLKPLDTGSEVVEGANLRSVLSSLIDFTSDRSGSFCPGPFQCER